ncbi:MAG: GNAT family N-acetyltransferase [Chloroflexi bacterium]|nr:GNAT family N-acetyltransferase [Chloroflexota bacterium]
MSDVVVRERTPDDDAAAVDLGNRLNPDFPPATVEESRFWEDPSRRPPGTHVVRLVAERDGGIVGYGSLVQMWWTERRDAYRINIGVEPDFWGQGIGGRMCGRLMEEARNLRAAILYGEVREDRPWARSFAASRGFEPTGHSLRMSRLDVHTANLDGFEDAPARLEREGIRVVTLREAGLADGFLRAFHHMEQEAIKDEPSSETSSETPFDLWRERILHAPGMSPDHAWVALDGDRPVGDAFLQRRGERAAFNNGTDVARPYRGRGIAKALKLRQILWARENGVDCFYTGNDVTNKPMLSINIRLGYRPLPSEIEVVKSL